MMSKTSAGTRITAVALMVIAAALVPASTADAAAYTKSVYAPSMVSGSQARGWADLSLDCSGTYGCWNYIKIEKSDWWGPSFIGGWWANSNGWNNITATLPSGCYYYRTTVDSYNDVAGGYGSGVNIGPVGLTSNGTKIYRYRSTWSSGWTRLCR